MEASLTALTDVEKIQVLHYEIGALQRLTHVLLMAGANNRHGIGRGTSPLCRAEAATLRANLKPVFTRHKKEFGFGSTEGERLQLAIQLVGEELKALQLSASST